MTRAVKHGTYNEYSNYGCRCRPCTDAARDYERGRRSNPVYRATQAAGTRRSKARRIAVLHQIKVAAGCADCGYHSHAEALDFDHRPGVEKVFSIAQEPHRPWAVMETEIAKCDVVCANCHRVRTASRRS